MLGRPAGRPSKAQPTPLARCQCGGSGVGRRGRLWRYGRPDGPAVMAALGYNITHAEEGGRGSDPSCRQARRPCRALHRADEGGATIVWPAGAMASSTFGSPRCAWTHQPACSCARVAVLRSCCAAAVTAATATAAARAGASPAMPLGATAQADISALGVAASLMPSGSGAGASVVAMRAMAAVVSNKT